MQLGATGEPDYVLVLTPGPCPVYRAPNTSPLDPV